MEKVFFFSLSPPYLQLTSHTNLIHKLYTLVIYNCNSANGFSLTAFCLLSALLSLMARAIFNFGVAVPHVRDDAIHRSLFMHLNIFLAVHLLKIIARLHTNASSKRKNGEHFSFQCSFFTPKHSLQTTLSRCIQNKIISVMEYKKILRICLLDVLIVFLHHSIRRVKRIAIERKKMSRSQTGAENQCFFSLCWESHFVVGNHIKIPSGAYLVEMDSNGFRCTMWEICTTRSL